MTKDVYPVSLAFHVPTGWEDYAAESILSQIQDIIEGLTDEIAISSFVSSSHVLLRFFDVQNHPPPAFLHVLRAYLGGELWAVIDAFLCAADEDWEQVRKPLEQEYWAKHIATSSKKEAATASVIGDVDKTTYEDRTNGRDPLYLSGFRSEIPPTSGEVLLLGRLAKLVRQHHPELTEALSILSSLKPGHEQTFRATLFNPSRLLPLTTLRTSDVAGYMGVALGQWLAPAWKVKLVNPVLDVSLRLMATERSWETRSLRRSPGQPSRFASASRSISPFPERLSVLLAIVLPSSTPVRHRSSLSGYTTLSPPIAHLLASMHPFFSPFHSDPICNNALMFDPCAGSGSIPREIFALAMSQHKNIFALVGDVHEPSVQSMMENLSGPFDPIIWNGKHGALRLRVVDGVVTDLPWGNRSLSPRAISALYPALLKRLALTCRAGGYGVFMTSARASMSSAIEQGRYWALVQEPRAVQVGGLRAWVWLLRNISDRGDVLGR